MIHALPNPVGLPEAQALPLVGAKGDHGLSPTSQHGAHLSRDGARPQPPPLPLETFPRESTRHTPFLARVKGPKMICSRKHVSHVRFPGSSTPTRGSTRSQPFLSPSDSRTRSPRGQAKNKHAEVQ
ncbi:hypothetical protein F4779DRAFT_617403 [Xylariaceae sp. FL0662B]|nr:hypothetical protein F4779DRAFT_617403 [Xylariaceae sp. FL0662B]